MSRVEDHKKNKASAYHLRLMTEADLANVMDIERRVYPFPWTEGIFRDCIRVGYGCWVMESAGVMHGYCIMMVGGGEAHVLNVCVRPESRNQGLGGMMMEHMMDKARHLQVDMMLLEVRPSNKVAIHLYNAMGFNELGVRKDYYPAEQGGCEDALILARQL